MEKNGSSSDLFASVLYHLAKKEGMERIEFASDTERRHRLIYPLQKIRPDVYSVFIFCTRYPYPYSYELEDALAILTSSRIITLISAPSFDQYQINEEHMKYIGEQILPRLSEKEVRGIEESLNELDEPTIKEFLEH